MNKENLDWIINSRILSKTDRFSFPCAVEEIDATIIFNKLFGIPKFLPTPQELEIT